MKINFLGFLESEKVPKVGRFGKIWLNFGFGLGNSVPIKLSTINEKISTLFLESYTLRNFE